MMLRALAFVSRRTTVAPKARPAALVDYRFISVFPVTPVFSLWNVAIAARPAFVSSQPLPTDSACAGLPLTQGFSTA
jgi:hypothetical protein